MSKSNWNKNKRAGVVQLAAPSPGRGHLLRVGLRHLEQLDEAVEQRHADGPQQHLEAGLHQLGQALHQAALAAVHLAVRRHHVGDEGVVGRTRLEETSGSAVIDTLSKAPNREGVSAAGSELHRQARQDASSRIPPRFPFHSRHTLRKEEVKGQRGDKAKTAIGRQTAHFLLRGCSHAVRGLFEANL